MQNGDTLILHLLETECVFIDFLVKLITLFTGFLLVSDNIFFHILFTELLNVDDSAGYESEDPLVLLYKHLKNLDPHVVQEVKREH